jgi:hypothetical protein
MNFMPSEDAFFDEPIHSNDHGGYPPQVLGTSHQPNSYGNQFETNQKTENSFHAQLLESSKRQEQLLEKMVYELERMNRRLVEVERLAPAMTLPVSANKGNGTVGSPTSVTPVSGGLKPTRGSLVLPPGSKVAHVPNLPERKTHDPTAEGVQSKEHDEQAAILRRRAEEEARIARLEIERKQREEEEERRRLEELKRLEDEKIRKQELENKTKGLMTGIFTDSSGGLFGPDDDLDVSTNTGGTGTKQGRGLFDD